MELKKIMSHARQRELVRINQVLAGLVVVLAFSTGYLLAIQQDWITTSPEKNQSFSSLRSPDAISVISVPEASPSPLVTLMKLARYERVIMSENITKADLMAIIWAAQGQITEWGERTVPSYKSTFPLSLSLYVRNVQDTPPGWYHFQAKTQQLIPFASTDAPPSLPIETFPGITTTPALLVLTTAANVPDKEMVWNEAGGIAQNILLMARERQLVTYLIPGGGVKPYVWVMPLGSNTNQDQQRKEIVP